MAYKYTLPGVVGFGKTFILCTVSNTPSNGTPSVSTSGSYSLLALLLVYVLHPSNLYPCFVGIGNSPKVVAVACSSVTSSLLAKALPP